MTKNVHFMSETVEWETPQAFFDTLNKEFKFTLDVCADMGNAKCKRYLTKEADGLQVGWVGERCWMNPPYGREIGKWVKKASEGGAKLVCCLLPARPDTRWFHDFIYKKRGVEVRFIKGRLKFGGSANSAPFPSMVVIFKQ